MASEFSKRMSQFACEIALDITERTGASASSGSSDLGGFQVEDLATDDKLVGK